MAPRFWLCVCLTVPAMYRDWTSACVEAQTCVLDSPMLAGRRFCLSLMGAGEMQGSARVIRCLQEHREQLRIECSMALFDQEVRGTAAGQSGFGGRVQTALQAARKAPDAALSRASSAYAVAERSMPASIHNHAA